MDKEKQIEEMTKCENCKHSSPSFEEKWCYCLNNERNKNTDKQERYKRTQGIGCTCYETKESEHSNV